MRMMAIMMVVLLAIVTGMAYADTTAGEESRKTPRIVDGNDARPGEYPWMALLVDADEPDIYYAHLCGAALISSKWVVTAAHCVKDEWTGRNISTSDIEVVLGIHDLKNDTGERVGVRRIIPHPDYDSWTMDSDIALVELEKDVLCETLPLVSYNISLEGQESAILGWGVTEADGSEYPDVLQEVFLPVVSNQVCNDAYNQKKEPYHWWMNWWFDHEESDEITDNMLCAGYADGGKDSCTGDSGGPLVVWEEGWKLAGITSWGEGCSVPGYYGVYTRVSEFEEFIDKHISGEVSYCGDFNGDGAVNRDDFNEKYRDTWKELYRWILDCWISKDECGDYTDNGKVNFYDWIEKSNDMNQELDDWIQNCWEPEL